jgi:short subunit fatty acids transporter
VLVLAVLIPILYCAIQPAEMNTVAADSARLIAEDQAQAFKTNEPATLARRLERAWVLNLIVVIAGAAALGITWAKSGFNLDISLFMPSGGGHWAVQGPFAVPAAAQLHASQAATAMAVAMGEQVTNMVQPFWALPVLAIAGISLRRVMGFTVMSFLVGAIVYGLALLVLV